jgi:flagellin
MTEAGDDGAGVSVSVRMEADKTSLSQSQRNINDGISFVQTIDGALGNLSKVMVRLRELSVQAANETYTATDRTMILSEMTNTLEQYDKAITATFNDIDFLNSLDTITFQVGKDGSSNDQINVDLTNVNMSILGLPAIGPLDVSIGTGAAVNSSDARQNLSLLDSTINSISTARSYVGSLQNRFEYALETSAIEESNLQAAQSKITDIDYASKTADMTRSQIQLQAGVASLAQAKSMPQNLLSLVS